jgi:predicted DNA repair protein MutK
MGVIETVIESIAQIIKSTIESTAEIIQATFTSFSQLGFVQRPFLLPIIIITIGIILVIIVTVLKRFSKLIKKFRRAK